MAEGYKAWTGGTVLDATELTDYTSSQSVMRFASAATRDAALTAGIVKEGMLAYLKDSHILTMNTNGTTTGWVQVSPAVTATIADAQVTNAKLAADSVTTTNIAAGTILGSDIATGTITGTNIQDGSIGPSDLAAGTYSITASNASQLGGLSPTTSPTPSTIAQRTAGGYIFGASFVGGPDTSASFYDSGTYTYIGLACGRVNNGSDIYNQVISSGRTVLVNSNLTLGTATSSERYKEDITPAQVDPAAVLQLEPVTFRYKAESLEPDAERGLEFGLIAEQAAELGLESVLFRDDEGRPDAIAYEKIGVLLLAVVKDQQSKIEALETRLSALEAAHAD